MEQSVFESTTGSHEIGVRYPQRVQNADQPHEIGVKQIDVCFVIPNALACSIIDDWCDDAGVEPEEHGPAESKNGKNHGS